MKASIAVRPGLALGSPSWSILRICLLVLALALVSGCRSDEDRAVDHFEKAQEYLASGESDRARIELLNVLKLTPNNLEARLDYAQLLLEAGDREGVEAQLQRVVDQDPTHLPSLVTLSELSMERKDWENARKFADRAAALAPEDEDVRVRLAVLDYADATAAGDAAARSAAHEALLALPDETALAPLHHAIVDGYMRDDKLNEALAALDHALTIVPEDLLLATVRLQILYRLDRRDEIVAQFEHITTLFPENATLRTMFADWYVEIGDLDAAEAVLRDMNDPTDLSANLELVRFLAAQRGTDAAIAELDRLAEASDATGDFRLMRAAIAFDFDQREAALEDVREVIRIKRENGEDSTEAQFLLAQMQDQMGARSEAEATLRALMSERPRHLEAAQMLARWQLDAGQPEPALRLLAAAQSMAPENSETMLLLAQAYEGVGNDVLAREMMASAFEASGYEAAPGLVYAARLADDGNEAAAIEVLTTALGRAPRNLALLETLGGYYALTTQWDQANAIEARLRDVGSPPALLAADRIRFDRLVAQEDLESALRYLDGRSESGNGSAEAYAGVARSNLASGRIERAQRVVDQGLERFPTDRGLRASAAALALARQQYDESAALYQGLIDETPQVTSLWTDLLNVRERQGDAALVDAVLAAALEANPQDPVLRWEYALRQEAKGDLDAAVSVYEALLVEYPGSAPVRNNLASLLSTSRDDPESLARAAEIAEPLKGSPVPQFLDTYGWIEFRLNAFDAASEALLAAAEALPEDALVQFHAAEALAAADRPDEARSYYDAALTLSEGVDAELAAQARAGRDALAAAPREAN